MAKPIQTVIVNPKRGVFPATMLQLKYPDGIKEFVFPLVMENYRSVGNAIRNAHFPINEQDANSTGRTRVARVGEYLDFLRECYTNPELLKDVDAEQVRSTMKNLWHWIYQGTLTTSANAKQKGIYVFDDPQANGRNVLVAESDLLKRLEGGSQTSQGVIISKDGTVRFAPKGTYARSTSYTFKTLLEAEKDGFQIAFCGREEGAQTFAEIAGLRNFFVAMPRSWKLGCEKNPGEQRVSALYGGDMLGASGDDCGGGGYGFALGVRE